MPQPAGSSGTNFQSPFNSNFSRKANSMAQQSKAKLPELFLPKFQDVTQWQISRILSLLKISAKIFDPIGTLSPLTIQWKILFQELCNEQLRDDHLKKLQTLNSLTTRRCYFEDNWSGTKSVELQSATLQQPFIFAWLSKIEASMWTWLRQRPKLQRWRNKALPGLNYLGTQSLFNCRRWHRMHYFRNWSPCSGSILWQCCNG